MKFLRQIAVGLVGGIVVLVGLILVPLPGPGFLIIAGGLGILASEFSWAKRWLKKVREKLQEHQPGWLNRYVPKPKSDATDSPPR